MSKFGFLKKKEPKNGNPSDKIRFNENIVAVVGNTITKKKKTLKSDGQ